VITTEKPSVVVVPEGAELIEDIFYVWKTRFGVYKSMTKDGRKMLIGDIRECVVNATSWYLKCEQDGTLHLQSRVVNSGIVAGKL
jgi:hypothetical protein